MQILHNANNIEIPQKGNLKVYRTDVLILRNFIVFKNISKKKIPYSKLVCY